MTSPLGFKARVGSALFAIFAEANVIHVHPQDSPLVLHLPTSWQLARSQSLPHMHVQRWTWLRFKRATTRTEDERTTIVPATRPTVLSYTEASQGCVVLSHWISIFFSPLITAGTELQLLTPCSIFLCCLIDAVYIQGDLGLSWKCLFRT